MKNLDVDQTTNQSKLIRKVVERFKAKVFWMCLARFLPKFISNGNFERSMAPA